MEAGDSNTITQDERIFLITEYQQLNSHIQAFWKMRLSVVVASIGVQGYFVKALVLESSEVNNHETIISIILLVGAYFVSVSLIASLTRPLWVFSNRMEVIGRHFTENEFWASWNRLPETDPNNTSLHPFYMLFIFIGILSTMAIFWSMYSIGWFSVGTSTISLIIVILVVIVSTMLIYTRKKLHVTNVTARNANS